MIAELDYTTLIILAALLGYLLGSVPFGLLLSKVSGYGDIRNIGSGNIGATNVLRTGNKKLAFVTLLCDGGKGAAAVALCFALLYNNVFHEICPWMDCAAAAADDGLAKANCSCWDIPQYGLPSITGLFAILGHCFPIWLKFKGGKGVATTLGMYLVLAPYVGLVACGAWLLSAIITRYSSLSALIAILIAPAAAHLIYDIPNLTGVCGFIALFVWFKHRTNIQRLIAGEEPKIGKKKKQAG
jgi:glycerol-3-phosphate acyltransferase PlsY